MCRLTGIDWVTLVVISTAFLFLFRGVSSPDSHRLHEVNYFPGLELHQCCLPDSDVVLLEKAKESGVQGLLYNNHPNDLFPEGLNQIFHTEERFSPGQTSNSQSCRESRV